MVIIGTGGLSKDVVVDVHRMNKHKNIYFYNDRDDYKEDLFLGKFEVIRSIEALEKHFKEKGNFFNTAIANPLLRYKMNKKAMEIGGVLTSVMPFVETVSPFSTIGAGAILMPHLIVSSAVEMGEGVFINAGSIIGHDVKIGQYCSFGPGVRILGNVEIGDFSYIGCNTVIAPGVKIGKKVRIGIGKIIESDVPDNSKIQ